MFSGSIPALVTPFRDGKVDEAAFRTLVDWQIEQGSAALVPCGTTGEASTLSNAEHHRVIEMCVEQAAGRVPIIAGCGSNDTNNALLHLKFAKKAGVTAGLCVAPYYNKPSQAGLIAHFTAITEAVDLPIIIYNIPPRSVIDMLPATMGELAKLKNIIGVKDATGDLARVSAQRITCGADFLQISGEDATAHGFNAQGGVGCISVTANVAPALSSALQNACLAGDYAKALEIQDRLMPLHQAIFAEPGLCGVKYAMSRLGLCENEVRLPLLPVSEPTRALIDAGLRHAGLTG